MEQTKLVRVLHVIGVMDRGGAETMIMNLYRAIDRSRFQFGFVVHTQAEGAYDREIRALGGAIYHCPRFTGKNYRAYRDWWRSFLAQEGQAYEIVHGHIGSTAPIYLDCARRAGKHTIAHSHNTNGKVNAKEILYRLLSARVRGRAEHYLACSVPAGIDRFGKGIRFSVWNNAIQAERYTYSEETRTHLRDQLQIGGALLVGHVGRFAPQKNHSFLLEIFAEIRAKTDAKLLLVGDGPLRGEIEEKAAALGLREDVIFTGVRSDVDALMQAMDVFVFPSFYEGLPVTMVEAQAAGLPCLISDGVPKETILTDLVRWLPLSAGARAWAQKALELGRWGRRDTLAEIRARGFDIADSTRKLETYYRRIAAGEKHICL